MERPFRCFGSLVLVDRMRLATRLAALAAFAYCVGGLWPVGFGFLVDIIRPAGQWLEIAGHR